MDAGDRLGPLPDRGSNPLDRAGADITDGEHAGKAGLEAMGAGGRRPSRSE